MLNWLLGTIGGWLSSAGQAVYNFVRSIVGGLAGILDIIFGHVGNAWDDLVKATRSFEGLIHVYLSSVWRQLDKIITFYIPHYAMVAWWWVTNPDALAQVLLWHVLKWLEYYAWTAAKYLGEFVLALLVRNLKRIALLAETVLAAVL